jgi:hypothetical protein
MKKLALSLLLAGGLAGSAYTIAAVAAPDGPDGGRYEHADRGFLLDAKLAGMKAALKLTPDQDKNWAPFEAAVRDVAKERMDARNAWRDSQDSDERPSPIAMMTHMSDRLAKASEEVKKVADAAKPLYDSLDDGQKRHFGPLVRMLREHGGRNGGEGEHRKI